MLSSSVNDDLHSWESSKALSKFSTALMPMCTTSACPRMVCRRWVMIGGRTAKDVLHWVRIAGSVQLRLAMHGAAAAADAAIRELGALTCMALCLVMHVERLG